MKYFSRALTFITVAALHGVHVLGLVALISLVALRSAVAARLRESPFGTVLGHVSGFVAATALDIVHLARLRAAGCLVVRSSAVAARGLVGSRLRAVASTMPSAATVDAFDFHAVDHNALRLAMLRDVAHF